MTLMDISGGNLCIHAVIRKEDLSEYISSVIGKDR